MNGQQLLQINSTNKSQAILIEPDAGNQHPVFFMFPLQPPPIHFPTGHRTANHAPFSNNTEII